MKLSRTWREAVIKMVQLFILMAPALYNTFPFISGDTAAYISSAMEWYVPAERPIFYSVFVRLTSLGFTLWGVILVQNLILLYLLRRSGEICKLSVSSRKFTVLILVLATITGVGWESNKLLADIFACFLFLSALIWMKQKSLRPIDRWLLPFIFFFSALTHYSHLVLALLMGVLFLIVSVSRREALRKSGVLVIVAVASFGSVMTTNWAAGHGFRFSRASSVFVMGKMVENGVVPVYLHEYCGNENWLLCQYKDSLPATGWQFVWDANSPVHKTGGWKANEEEYNSLLKAILSKPKYLGLIAYKAVENTAVQLMQWTSGDNLFRYEADSNVKQSIQKYFPADYPRSMWSRQFLKELPFKGFSIFYAFSLSLLTLFILAYGSNIPHWKTLRSVMFWVIVFLIVNAAVTSNLANISSRLQARVIWLPAWFIILGLVHFWNGRKEKGITP